MLQPSVPQKRFGPAAWVKVLVSLAILWQFYAILTTATAASSARFPAPRVAGWAFQNTTKWYLEPIFMTNPYRFYAPDPGPTNLLWYRVEYENGGVRWIDFADRQSFLYRIPYQRHMCLNMMIEWQVIDYPDPQNPDVRILAPKGVVCLESYMRHAAAAAPAVSPDGVPVPVKQIDGFHIKHIIAEPLHLRMGWSADDLRLHPDVTFLGTYTPAGKRIDITGEQREYMLVREKMSKLAAWIVEDLVASKSLKGLSGDALAARLAELQVPIAIRTLLVQFPELLEPAKADEKTEKRIRRLVESRDDAEVKRETIAGVHYPLEW